VTDLRHTLRVGRVLFASTFSLLAEYRAELAIWLVAGSLPLIMMFAWIGIAADRPIAGYDAAGFAAYFLTVFFVRQMTPIWCWACSIDPSARASCRRCCCDR